MGAGKSTLAWRAAEQTGRGYVDVDSDLEALIGPIDAYFDEHGEPAFRAVEEVAVTEALLRSAPSIIALGGGAVASAFDARAARGAGADDLARPPDLDNVLGPRPRKRPPTRA